MLKSLRFTFVLLSIIVVLTKCKDPTTPTTEEAVQVKEECVKEQWLSLYPKRNVVIFTLNDNSIDPYTEIKELLLNGEIRLWEKREEGNRWMESPLPSELHDSVQWTVDINYNKYFDFETDGYMPIKNSKGEDSIHPSLDGSLSFIYNPPSYSPITFDDITEIRIKEELVRDSISGDEKLEPVFLAFDAYRFYHNVLFWVKISDLKKHISVNTKWIDQIAKREYDGFIYKRYSCDDPDYWDD